MNLFFSVLVLVALCFCGDSAFAAKKKKLTAVADLRYGVSLYHYYQKEYMDALSELLVAKERGGIQGHGDNPEIMEGGFTLAYGMERKASAIFERVLEQNTTEDARAAAWFYLAKMRYLRGDYAAAQAAINKMPAEKYRKLGDDVIALRINIAIKQNDLALAEQILKKEKPGSGWMPYINFNMGSAWARQNNFSAAVAYLTLLAEAKFDAEEHKALYDKAMTAAGYSLLLAKRYDEALRQFSSVRLNSPLSGRALLGYGWAAAEKGDYKEALKAWSHLSKKTLIDENSQESLIAVPYAYEKLGAEGLALQYFQSAEQNYLQELQRLNDVIANLQGDEMLMALNIGSSEGIDWMRYAAENQLSPQLTYLVTLFAREEFQGLVQEMRDLLAIQKNTRMWNEKLEFYSAMLDDRERNRNVNSAKLAEEKLKNQIDELTAARAKLANKMEAIVANKDYFALASKDEADLINRVLRDQKYISLLRAKDPFIDESEESVRRYYGILLWDASEKFSERLWRVIKALNGLDETISEVRENYANVQRILREALDMAAYRARLQGAQQKLLVQQQNVDRAVEHTQAELRNQVVGALVLQRERLNVYLSQSRLSVARLYDKTRVESAKKALKDDENQEAAP